MAPSSRRPVLETLGLALAAAAAWLHLVFSLQVVESARILAMIAGCLCVFFFCRRQPAESEGARRAILLALAAAGTVLAIHGLWQVAAGFERMAASAPADLPEAMRARLASGRAVAGMGLPGALAGFLLLSLPVTAGLAARARRDHGGGAAFLALAGGLILQAAALIATRSAAALAALAAAAAIVVWSRAATVKGRRAAMAALAAGVAIAAALLAWRLSAPGEAMEGAGPFALRAGNWKAALAMIADHPLFGGGLGCYGVLFPSYRDWSMNESRFAHNSYLQIAAEAGPMGFLLAAWGALWIASRLIRSREAKDVSSFAAVSCLAFLLHNLVDFTFYLPSIALPFFCLAGSEAVRGGEHPESARPRAAGAPRALAAAALALMVLTLTRGSMRLEEARDRAAAGDPAGALDRARAAASGPLADPGAHALAASLLLERAVQERKADLLEEAERYAIAAVEADDRTPSRWHLLGRVRLARSDRQGAYIALHRAAQLYPIHIEYRRDRDMVAATLRGESR